MTAADPSTPQPAAAHRPPTGLGWWAARLRLQMCDHDSDEELECTLAELVRREWTAALVWESDQLRDGADRWEASDYRQADAGRYYASALEIDAHRIEDGSITPCADTPEPSTPPAQDATCGYPLKLRGRTYRCELPDGHPLPHRQGGTSWQPSDPTNPTPEELAAWEAEADEQDRTFGHPLPTAAVPAGPDPHPDTPGDAQAVSGVLGWALLDRGGYVWPHNRNPAVQGPDDGVWLSRAKIEDEYGPVREVLLITPAAWQRYERLAEAAQKWALAIETDDGRTIVFAEFALAAAVDALGGDHPAEPERPSFGAILGTILGAAGGASQAGADEAGVDRAVDDALRNIGVDPAEPVYPAEPAPEPADNRPREYDPATDNYRIASPAEPAPEPAGGPGWDRSAIHAVIDVVRRDALSDNPGGDREDLAQQLEALLADCDRGWYERNFACQQRDQAERERDAARAKLPEVTAELDRVRGANHGLREDRLLLANRCYKLEQQRDEDRAEADRLRAELARQDEAAETLDAERQRNHDLLATARRDAAAGALEFGAGMAVRWGQQDLSTDMRLIGGQIRAEVRPVPGSPEPAPAGGEEPDHG